MLLTEPSTTEYAELCGEELTAQAVLRFDDDSAGTAANATLQSRELLQNSCLYGVPEIAISPLAILKSGRVAVYRGQCTRVAALNRTTPP